MQHAIGNADTLARNVGTTRVEAAVSIGIAAILADDLSPDAVLTRSGTAPDQATTEGGHRGPLAAAPA
ncbi:MAG: hypothetical protein K2X75_03415 [Burkholderiaceae bacterium]|nr:hypothetical protein [Burkholderiaceae bacterium]